MSIYIGKPVVVSDMQGPCDEGFHVPLRSELTGLISLGVTIGAWTSNGGNNLKNYLYLPFAGARAQNTSYVSQQGTYGNYASATAGNNNTNNCVQFNSSNIYQTSFYRVQGNSIRAFRDTFVSPTASWTTIYQGTGNAGIFWNQTDGIISITSDGSTGYTIADKNVGATTVYNDGDTLSESNCGKYYQWGNNYGFSWTGNVTTSTAKIDASTYGPGNYYSSSTFIIATGSPYSWDSSNNTNLRGGVTQGTSTVNKEPKNIYVWVENSLNFTANTANSTIQLTKNGTPTEVTLETSTDGRNWSTYTFGDTITLSNIGDKVYWRNTSTVDTLFNIDGNNCYKFVMSGSVAGSGDINSLLNKNSTNTASTGCFIKLFENCTSLTSSPYLSATTLGNNCYNSMFYGCSNLSNISSLPSTVLGIGSYRAMFYGCTSLSSLPKLPATTLSNYCYNQMFYGCSKIKLSTTQTGEYQTSYRIPTTGTGTSGTNSLNSMFTSTGGAFTSDPSINTIYYTSNTVV